MKKAIKKPSFEGSLDEINTEISKRKPKWNLTALSWLDYEDVAQIIRVHIFKKWSKYNPTKPLGPWVNRIISNQIKNLIRNNYGNYSRPCLKCSASEGDDLCAIYVKQCSKCPLYAQWEKTKKRAYDTKLPVPLENHVQEVFSRAEDSIDIEKSSKNLHVRMEAILKPTEWKIYKALYIDNLSEEETATLMGYKTTEKNRTAGYKMIGNIKKSIIKKAKVCIMRGEIDIV